MRIDVHVHTTLYGRTSEQGLLIAMGRAHIDKAVLLPIDMSSRQLEEKLRQPRFYRNFRDSYKFCGAGVSFKDFAQESKDLLDSGMTNEIVHDFCLRHPDKFVGFGSVNPSKEKREIARRMDEFIEWGFKGIKLIPTVQFFNPAGAKVEPIYEKAEENGLVVLTHTGCDPCAWEYPPLSEDGRPKYLDVVARRHPDLKIIAAHMGSYSAHYPGIWFEEMMQVMEKRDNVYADISALFKGDLLEGQKLLRKAIRRVGVKRILFGSDHPAVEGSSMRSAAMVIDESGIRGRKDIMGLNAARVLGLN